MSRLTAVIAALFLGGVAMAHESATLEDLLAGWGVDLDALEVRSETVAPGLHVLFGGGGNVLVSIGEQGVLMVDSQFPEMIPKLKAAIRELGGDSIDFTINTHWHFDHADGNPLLGRENSWLVAHRNSRRMMTGSHDIDLVSVLYTQPPYPVEGLPVITYDEGMQFHFNGQTVDLMHFGPAHTTGDTAVYFRDANVVHMGDVFNARYPFVDAGNGGDVEGLIAFCEAVLDAIDEGATVVPGHGPVKTYADLAAYARMLGTIAGRISDMIDLGMSLDEVLAAAPTREFDEKYGDPTLLVNRAYTSLAR